MSRLAMPALRFAKAVRRPNRRATLRLPFVRAPHATGVCARTGVEAIRRRIVPHLAIGPLQPSVMTPGVRPFDDAMHKLNVATGTELHQSFGGHLVARAERLSV